MAASSPSSNASNIVNINRLLVRFQRAHSRSSLRGLITVPLLAMFATFITMVSAITPYAILYLDRCTSFQHHQTCLYLTLECPAEELPKAEWSAAQKVQLRLGLGLCSRWSSNVRAMSMEAGAEKTELHQLRMGRGEKRELHQLRMGRGEKRELHQLQMGHGNSSSRSM
jgi:hypothetical protein